MLSQALAAVPDHAAARQTRGLALLRVGQLAAGIADLRHAVRLAPHDALTHLHHGIGLMAQGRPLRAAARFRRAATLAPNDPATWINFGAALLALDHPQAARAAARRALRLAPGHADALHILARGHEAAGDTDDAAALLRGLVRDDPGRAAAWLDLGALHARRGAMAEARAAMRSALRADPGNSAALANLAAFSVLTGEQDDAIGTLREVLDRDPGCIGARLNLANALLLDRDAAAAHALLASEGLSSEGLAGKGLAGGVPPGREGAHWRAHLALALILLGRDGEAAQLLDEIAPPGSDASWGDADILIVNRRLQLARRRGDTAEVADLASRLETLSAQDRFLFEHRIIACFDLGRIFHDLGDRPRAFAQWQRGHALLKRLQPFDRAAHEAFVDASIAAFSAARLRDGSRASNTDEAPVFIVGLPRSGTTLAEQILAAHHAVHGAGERSALHDLVTARAGPALRPESAWRLAGFGRDALDEMAATFLADLHLLAPVETRIVDKMPANALHLGFIARLLPRARIILCTRDPRDVGLSIFQLRFFGHHPYAHDLDDLGCYIAQHERLMAHWRATLPNPLFEVALTDWSDDFGGTLARLLAFLDLPHDPASERFYEYPRLVRTASAAQIREKVHRRGIGKWRAYETELAPMLRAMQAGAMPAGAMQPGATPRRPPSGPWRHPADAQDDRGAGQRQSG